MFHWIFENFNQVNNVVYRLENIKTIVLSYLKPKKIIKARVNVLLLIEIF